MSSHDMPSAGDGGEGEEGDGEGAGGKIVSAVRNNALKVVFLLAFSVVLYVARPLFRPLLHDFVSQHPVAFTYLPATVVFAVIAYWVGLRRQSQLSDQERREVQVQRRTTFGYLSILFPVIGKRGLPTTRYVTRVVVVMLLLTTVASVVSLAAEKEHMAQEELESVEMVDELPEQSVPEARLSPRTKADVDAKNAIEEPTLRRSRNADLTRIDGRFYWSYFREPNKVGRQYFDNQNGALFSSTTTSDAGVRTVTGDIEYGTDEGLAVWDSYLWQLEKTHYTAAYQDPFPVVKELPGSRGTAEGEVYTAVPAKSWSWHLHWGIVPYTVPEFAGVGVVSPDGESTFYSPEEALELELLKGQNLQPYDLSMTRTRALNYRNGSLNVWFGGRGVFRIAEPQGNYSNSLPYTTVGADGSVDYYIPTSPQGSGDAMYREYVRDGRTGEMIAYAPPEDLKLVGPQRIDNYVQQRTPPGVTNWGEFQAVEPLPVEHDGYRYYMVRVIRKGGTSINSYAFVNASNTNEVVFATGENKDELARAFMRGENIEGRTDAGTTTPDEGENTAVPTGDGVRIIIEEDGQEVFNETLTGNVTVGVQQGGNSGNTTATPTPN